MPIPILDIARSIGHAYYPPADPTASFAGKTVLVTGANSGVGLEAAVKFAALGAARLILGVRDAAKGAAAGAAIRKRTGRDDGAVEVWPLDMLSYDSVRAFAARVAAELDRLDAAVLNAGVYSVAFRRSAHGWEETLQVNTLSTALLAILLLPKLRATPRSSGDDPPVLEIVGSGKHRMTPIPPAHRQAANLLASFNAPGAFQETQQYGVSKVFVQLLMQKLAALTRPGAPEQTPPVTVLAVCPGWCVSNLARGHMTWFLPRLGARVVMGLLARTTEQGARTLVSGVLQGPGAHGRFWIHDELPPDADIVSGDEGSKLREQVWAESLEALRKDVPGLDDAVAALGASA